MYQRSIFKILLALILPLATIAIAFWLDRWSIVLRDEVPYNLQYSSYTLSILFANLIIILLFLSIVWTIFVRGYGNKLLSIVYLLAGSVVILLPMSIFLVDFDNPIFSFLGPGTTGGVIRLALMDLGMKSWTTISGLYVIVIGLACLLMR